jgi:hypothetical protein
MLMLKFVLLLMPPLLTLLVLLDLPLSLRPPLPRPLPRLLLPLLMRMRLMLLLPMLPFPLRLLPVPGSRLPILGGWTRTSSILWSGMRSMHCLLMPRTRELASPLMLMP